MPFLRYSAPTPFGPSTLWPGEREHVGAERLDVDREPRRAGDRIDEEQAALRALRANDLADLADRLQRADLVVGELDRDDRRPLRDRGGNLLGVDPAVAIDRQLDDLEAELLEVLQRVEHRVVLDRAGHDSMAAALARPRGALQREVQRLGAAAGEDDLARTRPDRAGDTLMGLVERSARSPAVRVRRRGVAELAAQERQHRLERLRTQRRRGGVVEVDRHRRDCRRARPSA